MKGGPFQYQCHGSPGEASSEDRECLYRDEGLEFTISAWKLRWIVVPEIHANHNPKESTAIDREKSRSFVRSIQPFDRA